LSAFFTSSFSRLAARALWERTRTRTHKRFVTHASLHVLPHSVTNEPNPNPNRSSSIDGAVRLWDTRSSTCQAVSHGHVRGVLDLAPSPDFKSVVTASDDHTARVFRMVP
jgi:WD40 repeat protein